MCILVPKHISERGAKEMLLRGKKGHSKRKCLSANSKAELRNATGSYRAPRAVCICSIHPYYLCERWRVC